MYSYIRGEVNSSPSAINAARDDYWQDIRFDDSTWTTNSNVVPSVTTTSEAPSVAVRFESVIKRFGDFTAVGYRCSLDAIEHVALVVGEIGDGQDILVRVHSACFLLPSVLPHGSRLLYAWWALSCTDAMHALSLPHCERSSSDRVAIDFFG